MPIVQFPSEMYFLILQSSPSEQYLGSIAGTATELTHAILWVLVKGSPAGSERLRLNVYSRESLTPTSLVAQSDWAEVAEFGVTEDAYNYVRIDFLRYSLHPNITYYVAIETDSYMRVGESFYIGVQQDWPDPVNSSASKAGKMAIYGYSQ